MSNTQNHSRSKPKQQLPPKITQTITNVTKSTPFLIRKHHLDDSQMKSALHHDDITVKHNPSNSPKTYSYNGQQISCLKPHFENNHPNMPSFSRDFNQIEINKPQPQYYVKVEQTERMTPEVNSKLRENCISDYRLKQSQLRQKNDNNIKNRVRDQYGLRQISKATTKLKKQAQKYTKQCKQKVMKDINKKQRQAIHLLKEDIQKIKVQKLEVQRQKLMGELHQNRSILQRERIYSEQALRLTPNLAVTKKPKFYASKKADTDSSFSSFEL